MAVRAPGGDVAMRIVAAAPPIARSRIGARREARLARFEGLGLILTSAVIVLGLGLTYARQAREAVGVGPSAVNLNDMRDAGTLAAALDIFPAAEERAFAASAVRGWATAHGGFTHVGALAGITVTAADVGADRRLSTLRARAAARPGATDVPLFTPADIAALKPGLVVRTVDEFRSRVGWAALIFVAAFWIVHVVRRMGGRTGDPILVPAAQLLSGLAMIAMVALRDPLRDTDAVSGLAHGIALGCAAVAALAFVDLEDPRLRRATLLPLGAAVLLALALVLFGSGPGESGVKVNLLGAQPIEAIRLLAVLALASYFSRRWELLRELSEPLGRSAAVRRFVRLPRARDVQALGLIVGTLLVFFFLQRDLGPALVLGCLALAMYGVARGRLALVGVGLAALVGGFAVGYELGIPATLARRVAIWIDPWENARTGGDQIAHALWALASGGPWGAGAGAGEGYLVPAGQTDLIFSVIGEELGLAGVVGLSLAYALLVWRILRIATRAPGDYTAFLALGCALSLAVPALIIVGGQLGALPLSGVATPFLSFGKSSMLASFTALALALAIGTRLGPVRSALARQIRVAGWTLGAAAVVLIARTAWIQAWHPDDVAVRPALVRQGDGDVRYQYNPRLLNAARLLPRGTVLDRNGFALATGDAARADGLRERLRELKISAPEECPPAPGRCYPLGSMAYHLLGDWPRQLNWAARNASFVERDGNAVLQGFDDRPRQVSVRLPDGRTQAAVTRDYRELLPLLRHRTDREHPDVQRLLERGRDVHLTIDASLQALVARALEARVRGTASGRGAVVVVDVSTGALLALASYPWPDHRPAGQIADPARLLDRARYGLYPPGSTFKLITAAAALSTAAPGALPSFMCERLPDGRIGARVRGLPRPVRDDPLDAHPHGRVDLRRGLVVSCNAYFAQLALFLGPDALARTAGTAGIQISSTPSRLAATLPHAGYGQGDVVASPLRMARAVAAIAGDGRLREPPLVVEPGSAAARATPWLRAADAAYLRQAMREVVTSGSGRSLAAHPVAIAGKTGTAEINHAPSHAWFAGFAPYDAPRIAFAVLVENAGYGGRVAAPLAGDVVTAAAAAGLLR